MIFLVILGLVIVLSSLLLINYNYSMFGSLVMIVGLAIMNYGYKKGKQQYLYSIARQVGLRNETQHITVCGLFFHHQQRDKVTIRKQGAVQCAPASTPTFERKGGRDFFISARQNHLFGANGYREQRLICFSENHQVKYLLVSGSPEECLPACLQGDSGWWYIDLSVHYTIFHGYRRPEGQIQNQTFLAA